jgi:hypothetical protein
MPPKTEIYRGTKIAISATQSADQTWTAWAEYQGPTTQSVRVDPPQKTYATEAEARQGALGAAAESIDRARIATGKP